jgi:hypothetical protein
LGGTFWRLRIPNSTEFDGARITQETIPFSDARIVMRDSVPPLPPDTTGVSDAPPISRHRNALFQNDPNPFNPSTIIRFALERETQVTLAVYDVAGRRVSMLLDGVLEAGEHRALWDGRDGRGRSLPSGVYLYRLRAGLYTETRKMTLVR